MRGRDGNGAALGVWLVAALVVAMPAAAAEGRTAVQLPAQSLAASLESLAGSFHSQLLYSADLVKGLNGAPLDGEFTAEEALRQTLSGSGLVLRRTGDNSFAIVAASPVTALAPIDVATTQDKPYAAQTATVGGKTATPLREIPQSVSVTTRERMNDQNMTDLADVMKWATGVDARPNDNSQGWYNSRGYNLNIAYDGSPAYSALSGYQQFDLAMYDRVEVLRGPAGVFQGSGDFGGTVNMVRKHAKDHFAAEATSSIGSWNNLYGSADITGPLTESKDLRARFVVAGNDRDYYYDSVHAKKYLLYGILDWTPTSALTLSYSAALQEFRGGLFSGVPTYTNGTAMNLGRSTNTNTPWNNAAWQTHEEQVQGEYKFTNGWSAKATGTWREQSFGWKDGYSSGVNPANNTATYTLRDRFYRYERLAGDAYLTGPFSLFGREHTALVGANIESFDNVGTYEPATTVTNVNIFNLPSSVTNEFNMTHTRGSISHTVQYGEYGKLIFQVLDPLKLIVGGRISTFDNKTRSMTAARTWPDTWTQGGKVVNQMTPYGGLVYEVTKQTSVYASYSDIFAPQTAMMASGGVVPPRTGWQSEVGVKNEYLGGALQSSMAIFLMRDVNRAISDPNNTNYSVAAGEAESRGFEAELTGSPSPDLKLTAGYTYLTTQYLTDRSNQGATFTTWEPRHNVKVWGVYTFDEASPLYGFSLGSGVIGKSHTWNSGLSINQKPYAIVDAQIGYKFSDNLSSTLTVTNIFDTTYWATLRSTTATNIYGDPRAVTFAIKASM